MAKRGRKRDLDRELEYWDLLASGIGTVEACRRVGVTRKTGYRWRAEMGGVIAKKRAPQSGRYLSLFERQRIASLQERGHGVQGDRPTDRSGTVDGVARAGPQHPGVGRRIRPGEGASEGSRAGEAAQARQDRAVAVAEQVHPAQAEPAVERRNKSHLHLRRLHGEHPERQVCVESIYQAPLPAHRWRDSPCTDTASAHRTAASPPSATPPISGPDGSWRLRGPSTTGPLASSTASSPAIGKATSSSGQGTDQRSARWSSAPAARLCWFTCRTIGPQAQSPRHSSPRCAACRDTCADP